MKKRFTKERLLLAIVIAFLIFGGILPATASSRGETTLAVIEIVEEEVIGARVFNDAYQSIPEWPIYTPVEFNSERWDTDSIHNTSTNNFELVCPVEGTYIINYGIMFQANPTGMRVGCIRVNGRAIEEVIVNASNFGTTQISSSSVYYLEVDDVVTITACHTSGGNLDIVSVSNHTPEFMMHRLTGPIQLYCDN